MADNYALAMQKGVRAALVANAGVAALVAGRIYDEPPQNVVFPYIRFNEIDVDAFDTDTTEGAMVGISLEAHSRAPSGRVEAVRIAEAIKAALHRQEGAVTVSGFNLVELIFQTYYAIRETDGRGYTAVVSLEAMIETA